MINPKIIKNISHPCNKKRRLLSTEMNQMIADELNKDNKGSKHKKAVKIIRKNTKKLKEELLKQEEESNKLEQLLD